MDKIVKRSVQAQRQAGRRLKREMVKDLDESNIRSRTRIKEAIDEVRKDLKNARIARREDWELGPIAPKRDIGLAKYGAVSSHARMDMGSIGPNKNQMKMAMQRCAWAGGAKQLNLAKGDRVVIVDGPAKGKIDRIVQINLDIGTVKLEKHPSILVAMDQMNVKRSQDVIHIPISSIRLVYPITNPETGVTRDVIIQQLKAIPPDMQSENMSFDRWEYGQKWDRLVPGINVVIPWPDVRAPERKTTDADTIRDLVEQRTFYYNLLSPPMPENVLDELRNKYSKFRTRHEGWYVQLKEAEQMAKKRRLGSAKLMETPQDEYREKQIQLREARGEPELTEEMLEKIGEIMAKNQAAALQQAGITQESSAPDSTGTAGPQ